ETSYRGLLAEVLASQADDALAPWATHFYKVTRNYWPGLFHCYDQPEIPRTNNDLEHYFGTARHHERRATGQKRPTTAVAVQGAVRVVAAVASQGTIFTAADLRPSDLEPWQRLRAELEGRHERRRAFRRFRRDPAAYLATLEAQLLRERLAP
ncbi:MAG: ISNCY family transposase, partial [Chloroflexota bacterium]|nr:ISNCY family transposase [Chloroflexota bacterium]